MLKKTPKEKLARVKSSKQEAIDALEGFKDVLPTRDETFGASNAEKIK